MSRSSFRHLWCATTLVVTALSAAVSEADVVFSENFDGYADTTAVQAAWATTGGANGLSLANSVNFVPTQLADQSGLSNLGRFPGNNFATRALTSSVPVGSSWTISVDAVFETYSRSLGFGLTDADGNGYVMRWNATNVYQNSARGVVAIYKHSGPFATTNDTTRYGVAFSGSRPTYAVDDDNVPTGDPTAYTTASSANGVAPVTGYRRLSGTDPETIATYDDDGGAAPIVIDVNAVPHSSTWQGLVTWTLKYTVTGPTTATLAIYNNSPDNPNPTTIPVFEVTDTAALNLTGFTQFYLTGQNAAFDNIVVDVVPVPEPAALGLLVVGGVALVARPSR